MSKKWQTILGRGDQLDIVEPCDSGENPSTLKQGQPFRLIASASPDNAQYIVEVVNNHKPLVEFVRACKEPGRMGFIHIAITARTLLADIDKESTQ